MERPVRKVIRLLTPHEFEKRVRDYSRFDHMVRITNHVFDDQADRRITRRMILRALKKGTIKGNPEWDADHTNWIGKMQYLGSGMDITVVCAIQDGVLIVTVVTVYGRPS